MSKNNDSLNWEYIALFRISFECILSLLKRFNFLKILYMTWIINPIKNTASINILIKPFIYMNIFKIDKKSLSEKIKRIILSKIKQVRVKSLNLI